MCTRTERLVFLTLWCATLPLVVSVQSMNDYTCIGGCGTGYITTGTFCYVACPSVGIGCWDFCGYRYIKTGSFDSCTSKPNGPNCGPSSGQKKEHYKCVDNNSNNGDKCTGSVPVTNVDCEKTACPPPSCSSAVCAAAGSGSSRGIQCPGGISLVGVSGVSMTSGCKSTIPQGCQDPCDCGSCSTSSTSSGKHFSSSALFFCLQFMASTPDARPSDKFAYVKVVVLSFPFCSLLSN
jgi:hypothetical protein